MRVSIRVNVNSYVRVHALVFIFRYHTRTFPDIGMKMIALMGEIVQDNYPEVVKKTFLVNSR